MPAALKPTNRARRGFCLRRRCRGSLTSRPINPTQIYCWLQVLLVEKIYRRCQSPFVNTFCPLRAPTLKVAGSNPVGRTSRNPLKIKGLRDFFVLIRAWNECMRYILLVHRGIRYRKTKGQKDTQAAGCPRGKDICRTASQRDRESVWPPPLKQKCHADQSNGQ